MPPRAPEFDRAREVADLRLQVAGRDYLIGSMLEGDPQVVPGVDVAETVTVALTDREGVLADVLTDPLTGKSTTAARIAVAGALYVLVGGSVDDSGGRWELRFEDAVASQMRLFTKHRSFKRSSVSRTGAVLRLLQEASTPPLASINYWLPELSSAPTDADRRGTGGSPAATYTVKGKAATARQRQVIDGILTRCRKLGASKRVMIAALMAATQESVMGLEQGASGGTDDVGIFQQGRNWISVEGASQPGAATTAFLITGPTSWKEVHGSIKNASKPLWQMVYEVQNCRADLATQYGKWEAESKRSVEAWLAAGGEVIADDSGDNGGEYVFARGDQGARETSWDATGRWAQDVGAHRWAQRNVFCWVSDNELRAGKASLTIDGSEDWMLSPLGGYEFSAARAVETCSFRLQADSWALLVGAAVDVVDHGVLDGRWIVRDAPGGIVSPEVAVTLSRPVSRAPEPPADTSATRTTGGTGGAAGGRTAATWAFPTSPRGPITSGFGARSSPGGIGSTNHDGIDVGVGVGTKVLAANGGKVTQAGANGGYGNYVEIAHSGGLVSFYGHLSQIKVRVGQVVDRGDVIALSGNTGNSTGPHLHFGMHENGVRIDPSRYVR